jgi:hypothetical protein
MKLLAISEMGLGSHESWSMAVVWLRGLAL